MATWNFRSTSPTRLLVLVSALALARCSGSSSSGGSGEPPPPPPPVDPARFQVALGGAGTEQPSFVAATDRGGALIVATTDSFGADGVDVWLVETDEVGTIVRDRRLGGQGDDTPTSFDLTPDGGLVVAVAHEAGTSPEAEVIRLDAEWSERWRVPSVPAAIEVVGDGDVAVAGPTTDPVENGHAVIVRLDPEGHERWRAVLDGGGVENARSVTEGPDGDLYVTGVWQSSPVPTYEYASVFVARLEPSGSTRWLSRVPPDQAPSELVTEPVVRPDGSLVLAGTASYLQGRDFSQWPLWIELGSDGAVIRHEYRSDLGVDGLGQLRAAGSGFDVIGGSSILRLDASGAVVRTFPSPGELRAFDHSPDGGFWLASGTSAFGRGGYDILLAKLDPDGAAGPPPTPTPLPAATTFGALETIGDAGPTLASLFLTAAEDPTTGPRLTWWWDSDGSGSQPIESASRDPKGRWSTQVVAASGSGGAVQALVATSPGRAVAAWVGSPEESLYASDLDPRRGWAPRTRLDPDVGSAYFLDLAADSAGHAAALWWQTAFGIDALGVRRFDAESSAWAAPQLIPRTTDSSPRSGQLALGPDGHARAIWSSTFELGGAHELDDRTWQNDGPFVVEPNPIYALGSAPSWNGDVLATWTVYHDQTAALRGLWVRDGKPAGAPIDVAEVPILDATSFMATVDGDGLALVVWTDHLTLVAAESDANGGWSTPVRHPQEAAQGARPVGVAALATGDYLVSFVESRDGHGTVWATRYRLGDGWGTAEYLGDGHTAAQAGPTIAWRSPAGDASALVARTAR